METLFGVPVALTSITSPSIGSEGSVRSQVVTASKPGLTVNNILVIGSKAEISVVPPAAMVVRCSKRISGSIGSTQQSSSSDSQAIKPRLIAVKRNAFLNFIGWDLIFTKESKGTLGYDYQKRILMLPIGYFGVTMPVISEQTVPL